MHVIVLAQVKASCYSVAHSVIVRFRLNTRRSIESVQ